MWIQSIISVFLRIRPWCSKAAIDTKCPLNTKAIMRTFYQIWSIEKICSLPYIKQGISAKGSIHTGKHCIKNQCLCQVNNLEFLSLPTCVLLYSSGTVWMWFLFVCMFLLPGIQDVHIIYYFLGKLHRQWMNFLGVEHATVIKICEARVWSVLYILHAPSQNDVSQS